MIAVITHPHLVYPAEPPFHPTAPPPELPAENGGSQNEAYAAVRQAFLDAGLDAGRAGTPDWNPLGEFVEKNRKVFILPNFVYHRRTGENRSEFFAKCTHAAVLRPIIDYALKAVGPGGRVEFGNAPVQSCDWDRVLRDTHADSLVDHYRTRGAPVAARDLRGLIVQNDALGRIFGERETFERTVDIDLGARSALNALYGASEPRFRVADYSPAVTEGHHAPGRHSYVVSRAVLESDLVISVPKMKTHEKVGVTCGLKGFVGIASRKECLAHHRRGGTSAGGDEYPGYSHLREILSNFDDAVQRGGGVPGSSLGRVADRTLRRLLGWLRIPQLGGWAGNDTAWRMALDLARIASFASENGSMAEVPRRRLVVVVDGVVGGEGEGPLAPTPIPARTIVFGTNVAATDATVAALMGFSPVRIPLIREALASLELCPSALDSQLLVNGARVDTVPLAAGRAFAPPRGWAGLTQA